MNDGKHVVKLCVELTNGTRQQPDQNVENVSRSLTETRNSMFSKAPIEDVKMSRQKLLFRITWLSVADEQPIQLSSIMALDLNDLIFPSSKYL